MDRQRDIAGRLLVLSCFILAASFIILLVILLLLLSTVVEPKQNHLLQETAQTLRLLLTSIPPHISWPILILTVVLYLGWSSSATDRLSRLFRIFRTVKLLGAEVSFSEEGARNLFLGAEDAFAEFRQQADREFQRQARRNEVRDKLGQVFHKETSCANDDSIRAFLSKDKFRCTIHLPDILFDDTLYQLLDYYPDKGAGGKAGRRFSMRYGIMGRAWRMRADDAEAQVAHTKDDLVRAFGMHLEEAETKSRQRPAYISVILEDEKKSPLGILFMDSEKAGAFGEKDHAIQLAADVERKCKYVGLNEALANVVSELRKYDARIRIHG